jgi:Xaa-Pro aminopeptidase
VPQLTLQSGMTIVVQPNVVTPDASAGVQVGELVVVTESGYERLHAAPREFFRL